MSESFQSPKTRREFLINTSRLAAASALAGVAIPAVHAAGSDLVQVALIGCGGRGTGAAADALNTKSGPIKLVAMADVFENRLTGSYNELTKRFASQLEVPEERKFIGFDAYQKAMNCLKPTTVSIPPALSRFLKVLFQRPTKLKMHLKKNLPRCRT